KLVVHVRQRVRGDDETQDIVTDAFIRARGHFDRLDHDPLYLHRIARSLIRERREQDHRAPGADVASVIDLEEDPMLSALLTEEQAEVHRAFAVLTAVEREVLELSYAEEMSPTQIAEMTGKSLVAVRALLNEALVKVGMELRILQVDLLNYPPECREIHIPRLPAYL